MSTFFLVRNLESSYPNDVSCIAAILVGFTDYFVLLGTHTFLESLISPVIILGLAYFFANPNNQSKFSPIISGFLIGLSLFAKPDSIIIISTTLILFLARCSSSIKVKNVLSFALGLTVAVSFCAWEEYVTYGYALHSPIRWWKFRYQVSHKVYGSLPKDYYMNYILNTPIVLAQVVTSTFSVAIAVFIRTTKTGSLLSDCNRTLSVSLGFLTIFFVNVSILSYLEHKDVRFLHDSMVILACSCSCTVFVTFRFLRTLLIEENQEKLVVALKLFIYAEALMCVVRSSTGYPSAKNHIIRDPALVPPDFWQSSEVSASLDFIGRKSDVSGLVLDFSIHRASGYAGFHKKVPLIAKTFQDFREWTVQTGRVVDTIPSLLPWRSKPHKIVVHSFDDVGNFYAEENGLLVLKYVIEHPIYNYAILTRNRKFPHVGFNPIFKAGNTTVFKRIKSKRAKEDLRQLGLKLEAVNATVLEYEARWLISLGLKSIASQRIELALKIDKKCVGCWQILYYLNENDGRVRAKEGCYKHVEPQECGLASKMPKIHQHYSLGVVKVFTPNPII